MKSLTLSLLHSFLVNQVPIIDPVWREQILNQQFPSQSKRGGLGFGGHAKITLNERSQFCNINLFGQNKIQPRFKLEQNQTINDFTIIDTASNEAVGTGKFFAQPAWYKATLNDGRKITDVLQAHMGKEAVSVIGKTRCAGFDQNTACKYCSLQGGPGNPSRAAADIIEALETAMQHDWKPASLALTTTWIDNTNHLGIIAYDIGLIKARFPWLPIAFEAQPLQLDDYKSLYEEGVNTIMIPIDSIDAPDLFTPIKQGCVEMYMDSFLSAKKVFPIAGSVTSPLIVGLDRITTTLALIKALVGIGVKPEPVPLRVFDDRIQERTVTGNLEMAKELTRTLWSSTWGNVRVSAGCSQCGGCSGV